MNYHNIDYSRLLSYDEISSLSNTDYQTIINYCQYCHNKYLTRWVNNHTKTKKADGHYYYSPLLSSAPGGPLNGNTMIDANYFKNSHNIMLENIDNKYRELILTNYIFSKNELFIKMLNQALNNTNFTNISQLFEKTQKLVYLYHNDYQKFLFMKTAFKLDYHLITILNFLYEYYQVTDPVIIINKITEVYVKQPQLFDSDKIYNKK